MFLQMRHQTPDAPKGRRASPFRTAEDTAEGGLHGVQHVISGLDMAFEEERPAELDALGDHDAGIVPCAFLVVNQAAFKAALGTLPIRGHAVHPPGTLAFRRRLLLVPDLESPCPFAETCILIGWAGEKILHIQRDVGHGGL